MPLERYCEERNIEELSPEKMKRLIRRFAQVSDLKDQVSESSTAHEAIDLVAKFLCENFHFPEVYIGTDYDEKTGKFKDGILRPKVGKLTPELEALAVEYYLSSQFEFGKLGESSYCALTINGSKSGEEIKYGVIVAMKPVDFLLSEKLALETIPGQLGSILAKHEACEEAKQATEDAMHDPKTGAYNPRAFENDLETYTAQCKRGNENLYLVMFDIDHFKQVNDNYGHPAGDRLLKQFADLLSQKGVVYRLGGEEFGLILRETDMRNLAGEEIDPRQFIFEYADAMREAVQSCRFEVFEKENADPLKITTSIGISKLEESDNITRLIEKADEALYDAKHVRNTVRMYQPSNYHS